LVIDFVNRILRYQSLCAYHYQPVQALFPFDRPYSLTVNSCYSWQWSLPSSYTCYLQMKDLIHKRKCI